MGERVNLYPHFHINTYIVFYIMKLYKNQPEYLRLDDDVSFQILRTNPKLTTNTKLMYDGENLYMDSYSANPLLSTMQYKHYRVWKTGLFNRDIRNFLLGTNTSAYEVGHIASDTTMLENFDNQFENIYWCGTESINSDVYPQEMGCIAPLYLRKKLPNYFVIFKIDNPANTNMTTKVNDEKGVAIDFVRDIKSQVKILKTFDLREGTPIGNYIKRYVEQKDFKYDQSIYVNFSSHKIYYYGIDKKQGVLTQKVENFDDQLLKNDNTVMKDDSWITSGFERNNLIFPYILNIEFLFDDTDIKEYKFARYFGMYCNDIDLYDLSVGNCIYDKEKGKTTLVTGWNREDYITLSSNNFNYIKDKDKNIHSIKSTYVPGLYECPGEVKIDSLTGFEKSSVSTYAERLSGVGKAFMILEIVTPLVKSEQIKVFDTITSDVAGTFIASNQFGKGEFYENYFSCKGTVEDQAEALAGTLRCCTTDNFKWITAYNIGNKVIIQAQYPGANLNNLYQFGGGVIDSSPAKIKKLMEKFEGGTNLNNCMFKVYTDDADIFFDESGNDRDKVRYLKTGVGRDNAEILAVVPYINENNQIDDTYSVVITDENGPYVNVSNIDQIEIVDKYYPKLGVLSFFPVRDFDFDTVSSAYGDYSQIEEELKSMQDKIQKKEDEDQDEDDSHTDNEWEDKIVLNRNMVETLPYKRFYDEEKDINTEYDYYCENLLPSQSLISKTVPYITKWGYMDESKDSCENPYRLNASKIFETANFSANTFMTKGDIANYTHSMPYYVVKFNDDISDEQKINGYQYIPYTGSIFDGKDYEDIEAYFTQKKEDGKEDPFDALFGDASKTTQFKNKRFNKKYSRFLLGNDMTKSSTLFRGVKFEVTELDNDKEVKTGKYNGYKFSFVYVPVDKDDYESDTDLQAIHFIKNDDYKFIVGIVFFNTKSEQIFEIFNKSCVYAGCMGFLEFKKWE